MKFFYLLITLVLISCSAPKETIKRVNVFKNPNTPPVNCTIWFDGCNKCSVHKQRIRSCTKMACFKYKPKKCLKFETGPSENEVKKLKCKKSNGVWQRKTNGRWICMNHTKDHNQPCKSSRDCKGLCLYYKNKPTGFCSRYTPFVGCAQEFNDGKHFEVCE